MELRAETKNPFLTPGTHINKSEQKIQGKAETTVFFIKALASLIPISSSLSLATHSAHLEVAQAAQDAWTTTQGLMVVAGLQVIQSMTSIAEATLKDKTK